MRIKQAFACWKDKHARAAMQESGHAKEFPKNKQKIFLMISTHNPKNSYLEKTGNSAINPTKMNKLTAWGK